VVDFQELVGSPLGPDGKPKPIAASDFWSGLVKQFPELEKSPDREAIKLAADAIVTSYLALSFGFGLVPVEGFMGAFAFGNSISHIMQPLIDRRIVRPVDAALRTVFREDAPNARMLIQMMQEGVLTSDQLAEAISDTEVSDKYLPLLDAYTRAKQNEKAIGYEAQMADALAAHYVQPYELLVGRAESELTRLGSEVQSLATEVASIEDNAAIRQLSFYHSKLQAATLSLEEATDDKAVAKYANQVQVLVRKTLALFPLGPPRLYEVSGTDPQGNAFTTQLSVSQDSSVEDALQDLAEKGFAIASVRELSQGGA
jgi:hypothetical protein